MRTLVLGFLFTIATSSGAATLGDFAGALAVPTAAGYSAKNWNALDPVKGVKWRDATLKEAPSSFAREGDFALDGHGSATVLVVGARQMMFDVEVTLSRLLERRDIARTLSAQFPGTTLLEQVRGRCPQDTSSGGSRVYRVTLPGRRPLYMRLDGLAVDKRSAGGTRFSLSIDDKPGWAC